MSAKDIFVDIDPNGNGTDALILDESSADVILYNDDIKHVVWEDQKGTIIAWEDCDGHCSLGLYESFDRWYQGFGQTEDLIVDRISDRFRAKDPSLLENGR